jgi:hypothetical protein
MSIPSGGFSAVSGVSGVGGAAFVGGAAVASGVGGATIVSALPRAGAGIPGDGSISFLLVAGIIAVLYGAAAFTLRRLNRRRPALEDDGITMG